jgi:8-amino-3,8-dideoxy-alpha-D-manno-octulosonate transaminase
MATQIERLALHGGTPVRTTPLDARYAGARSIGEEELRLVAEVLKERALCRFASPRSPDKVFTLEREFAAFIGSAYALGVTSGTAALKVALRALGIQPGDEVILPSLTHVASASAVASFYATPVFAEVDDSLTLDPQDAAAKITPRTKAIMVVHVGGVMARMDRIQELAKQRNLLLLEDCAQACGASYRGRKAGAWGDAGTFSFHGDDLIAAGEGGMVTTNGATVFERAVAFHDHGNYYRYARAYFDVVRRSSDPAAAFRLPSPQSAATGGDNYHMSELSGAVALAQLRKLPGLIAKVREVHDYLRTELIALQSRGLRKFALQRLPDATGVLGTSLHFLLENPAQTEVFVKAMSAEGVPVYVVSGGKPVYLSEAVLTYRPPRPNQRYGPGLCPRTEDLLRRLVWLPLSPFFTPQDCDDVLRTFQKVAAQAL